MNKLNMFKTLAIMGGLWLFTASPAMAGDQCGNSSCQSGHCNSGCNSCGHNCGCKSRNIFSRLWNKHKSRNACQHCQGNCDGYCDGVHGNYCDGYCDGVHGNYCDGDCDNGHCDGHCNSCRHKSIWKKMFRNPFCPSGECGEGTPLFDKYNITYAAQPNYFDQRDGRLYSAQGYGVPMAVPLAPNVRNTYNLGWGIPSSRLTPVSRMIPDSRAPVRR